MKTSIRNLLCEKRNLLIFYLALTVIGSIQALFIQHRTFDDSGIKYTDYNNYIIFKKSFDHLKNNQDLYTTYPNEHWDLYKYTPTFSVFFGVFSVLPDAAGLTLWNLLNTLVLLMAVYFLPRLSLREKGLVLLLLIFEVMTSVQNHQSNALIAGLIIFTFGLLERKQYFLAACCIVFSVYIKLFGLIALLLFLFYPQKWKLAAYTSFWFLFFFMVPLLLVSPEQYKNLLLSYWDMLRSDHAASHGLSVMGWFKTWFGIEFNKNIVVLTGLAMLVLPYLKFRLYKTEAFRFLALCAILIWVVIFNHKAESSTFIIAMSGVALWFVNSGKSMLHYGLFLLAFVFTSLSPTDLFPRSLREDLVIPYVLKAVPCIWIWVYIFIEQMKFRLPNETSVLPHD